MVRGPTVVNFFLNLGTIYVRVNFKLRSGPIWTRWKFTVIEIYIYISAFSTPDIELQMEKPQMEIVNHFKKEGYHRQAIYDAISRMQLGETINDKKKTGRPNSWTPSRKNQLKRLINKFRGSQFGHMLGEKADLIHPRASSKLELHVLDRFSHYSKTTVWWADQNVKFVP